MFKRKLSGKYSLVDKFVAELMKGNISQVTAVWSICPYPLTTDVGRHWRTLLTGFTVVTQHEPRALQAQWAEQGKHTHTARGLKFDQ